MAKKQSQPSPKKSTYTLNMEPGTYDVMMGEASAKVDRKLVAESGEYELRGYDVGILSHDNMTRRLMHQVADEYDPAKPDDTVSMLREIEFRITHTPRWDSGAGELWCGKELVRPVANQGGTIRPVLDVFEEKEWPTVLTFKGKDVKNIVATLNQGLKLMKFCKDGRNGIRWKLIPNSS